MQAELEGVKAGSGRKGGHAEGEGGFNGKAPFHRQLDL